MDSLLTAFVHLGWTSLVWVIVLLLGAALVIGLRALLRPGFRPGLLEAWGRAQPFVFASVLLGFMAGNSRTAAMGSLIPAALTLIGGLVTTLVARDRPARLFAGAAVFGVGAGLFIGTAFGSLERDRAARDSASRSDISAVRHHSEMLTEAEDHLRTYRRAFGLPDLTQQQIIEILGAGQRGARAD